MAGMIREVQAFQLNGWTIRPCSDQEDGFDLVHHDERYHHDHMEVAVAAAQASPRFSPQHIDTDEMVLSLHGVTEYLDFTKLIFRGHTVHRLIERIKRYEKNLPSWLHSTPEDVDAWLRDLIPDDKRLAFYQWIGKIAVREAVDVAVDNVGQDPTPPEHRYYSQDVVYEFFELIDPDKDGGPFPSALPVGRPFCDVPHHTHTDGGGRLPTCRLDSEE